MENNKNNIRKVVVSLTEEEFKAFDAYCKLHDITKQKVLRDYISSLVKDIKKKPEEIVDKKKTRVSVFKKKFKFGKKKKKEDK